MEKDFILNTKGRDSDKGNIYPSDRLLRVEELLKISGDLFKEKFIKLAAVMVMFSFLSVLWVYLVDALNNSGIYSGDSLIVFWGMSAILLSEPIFLGFACMISLRILGDKEISIKEAVRESFFKLDRAFLAGIVIFILMFNILFPIIILIAPYFLVDIAENYTGVFSVAPLVSTDMLNPVLESLLPIAAVFCILLLILFFAFENFLLFALFSERRSFDGSLSFAFGAINRHKIGVALRLLIVIFPLCLLGTLLSLMATATNPIIGVLQSVLFFIGGIWLLLYMYALYGSLEAVEGGVVRAEDSKNARFLMLTGVILFVLLSLIN